MSVRRRSLVAVACATAAATSGWLALAHGSASSPVAAATPIQHLVVIFDENESFDHYFGTYPNAANPPGEPAFTAAPGTPAVNGLQGLTGGGNPNSAQPFRLDRSQALTCDQNHNYADEQKAFNGGAMNRFVEFTAGGSCDPRSIVMGYYDGNTVTALWNLAQHFAMSDNYFGSTFGPSTPGALNLIAGQTHGAGPAQGGIDNGTMIGDPDPLFDDCSGRSAEMTGTNIGDAMNTDSVTWGWFQGGFRPTSVAGGTATCGARHANVGGGSPLDYSAHHEPFMYYASTANPHHDPPSSVAMIGHTDGAMHQYDLADFDDALRADNLPQVSFLKPASFEDGHPGNSDPLDEQHFIVRTLNELQQSPAWSSTAVVITYDDSDGWYDHAHAPITQHSQSAASDSAICNTAPSADYDDRCGPGPRLPLLVVSPYVDPNTVDHRQLEQASIIRFIEDNWLGSRRLGDHSFDARADDMRSLFDFNASAPKLILDPVTGALPASATPAPTATASPAPTVAPPTKFKPKLAVTARRSGRRLALTLKVSNVTAAGGRVTLTARLKLRRKTLASSARHTVRAGRVKLVLKTRQRLKKGRYTLTVRIAQGTRSATLTRTLKLR